MTETPDKREDPLNTGGGCSSPAPFRSWSSCHRRRRGPPVNKQRQGYGPKANYEPPRKHPKQQRGPGPWFQPPRSPYWAMYSHWGPWGGPWCPPPMAFRNPPGPVQVTQMYGPHPVCLCCCSCWCAPWNPGWVRPPGRKKRWGRRGRGPPRDVSAKRRPVNLRKWRAPGMRAPRNTTQFIMNQIYEDMRQQEKLERQQEALRAQQAQEGENEALPSGGEEDTELQDILYGFAPNPLALSPDPKDENQPSAPQLVEKEEKNEECDRKEESEEEMEEADYVEEEEAEEEAEEIEEEEEGLEEDEQKEEENYLPLEMPLSFLVQGEEERESFINYYFSPKQIIPEVAREDLLILQDINC